MSEKIRTSMETAMISVIGENIIILGSTELEDKQNKEKED